MAQCRTPLSHVNSHLLCVLCGGYFIDATTICECLHSFCRSCIVKHLETSRFCPICDVQLHKSRPLLSIRPDNTLQRLVYKVVPGLYQTELKKRKEFYSSFYSKPDPEHQNSERARLDLHRDLSVMGHYQVFSPDDRICISLEYYDSNAKSEEKKADDKSGENSQEIPVRYLQCPAPFTVQNLKKFLKMKYQLKQDHKVDIYYQTKILPDYFSLIDVAHFFNWDRMSPMRFGFQLLERHAVVVNNATRVMVTESSPSSSLEETPLRAAKTPDTARSDQSSQKIGLPLGKKKSREHSVEEAIPLKKSRNTQILFNRRKPSGLQRKIALINKEKRNSIVNGVKDDSIETLEDSNDSEMSSKDLKTDESKSSAQSRTGAAIAEVVEAMDAEEGSHAAEENHSGQDASQNIEEVVIGGENGEPLQDFALQEIQTMDISEDLEDDDEDRLRICDPEEIPEEKTEVENSEETREVNVQPGLECENQNIHVEAETEVVKKDGKSRKKNKKSKHHHRHKRDYSPAPEATIVSGDKNDFLKLKVKLTRPDSDSRHHRLSDNQASRQFKHQTHAVEENLIPSPSVDDDSRHSQSTDDHDTRSIGSSKEGQDEESKTAPVLNGVTKSQSLSTKEKLLQMRQVRHKNITPPPPPVASRAPLSTTISKVSAEEANKNTQKPPILITSPNSSLTVSKVTAEERLKMMNNNNLGSTKPSLEIIMVNKPNSVTMTRESTMTESQTKQKTFPPGTPIVKLEKSSHINAFLTRQNAESISKAKNSEASKKVDESQKSAKDDKINSDKTRSGENKKSESFGVLDLSGKSTRSCGSSPTSEGSCSSPKHTAVSLTQSLLNRHPSSMNSTHRSNSNNSPVSSSAPKGSPNSSNMWNLMTLSNTAVQLQNMKMSQAQEVMKRQLMNNQKKASPRASPTQLKIPTPNLSLNNKFITRPKIPGNPNSLVNSVRPTNKPMVAHSRAMSSSSPSRPITSFPNMHQSQSAAVAKKQAGINGRNPNIPPPPPAIPISALYKMESMAETMARKYEIVKIARGLSAASKAAAGIHSS